MPLDRPFEDVIEFHTVFDHPIGDAPRMQPPERVAARAGWLEEEARELREATTIADQADAYIDSIYFALGGLVDMGVDPSPIWAIVQRANMAKVWADGSVRRRKHDGKIIKPDTWVDPKPLIEAEIARQLSAPRP
jgi:predicted HAD superfamily Cof-like phosphohydrolase